MKRLSTVLLICALVVLSVAGCSPRATGPTPPTGSPGTTGTPSGTPTPTTTPTVEPSVSPTSTAPTKEAVPIVVYFSYKEKMQAVQRYAPAGTVGVLKAALTALFDGPTKSEKAAGLSSQIPAGTKLRSVRIRGNVAIVDLSTEYDAGGGSLSMFNRIAQVVYTSTQFRTVAAVDFRIEGEKVDALGGEGIVLDGAQTRKDWEDQAPAILVDSPAWGGVLHEGDTARGTANVFEATFQIELKDSAGLKLFSSTVTATSGTGTRGDWTAKTTLGSTTAKKGTLKVFEYSAKDGKPVNVVEIPVVLER